MARKNLLSRHRVASSLRNRRRFIGRGRNLEGRAAFKNNNRRLMSGHPISPDAKRIQVVAYWRLKTIENSKTTSRKIGRGRLHELVSLREVPV